MTSTSIAIIYVIVLLTVSALYVFTAIFSSISNVSVPGLGEAIPVFVDLIKVIVGAAIGAVSAAWGKTGR